MLEEWVRRDTTAQQDSPPTFCLGTRPHGLWSGTRTNAADPTRFQGLSSSVGTELAVAQMSDSLPGP